MGFEQNLDIDLATDDHGRGPVAGADPKLTSIDSSGGSKAGYLFGAPEHLLHLLRDHLLAKQGDGELDLMSLALDRQRSGSDEPILTFLAYCGALESDVGVLFSFEPITRS